MKLQKGGWRRARRREDKMKTKLKTKPVRATKTVVWKILCRLVWHETVKHKNTQEPHEKRDMKYRRGWIDNLSGLQNVWQRCKQRKPRKPYTRKHINNGVKVAARWENLSRLKPKLNQRHGNDRSGKKQVNIYIHNLQNKDLRFRCHIWLPSPFAVNCLPSHKPYANQDASKDVRSESSPHKFLLAANRNQLYF